jgi:hypothetical protein
MNELMACAIFCVNSVALAPNFTLAMNELNTRANFCVNFTQQTATTSSPQAVHFHLIHQSLDC